MTYIEFRDKYRGKYIDVDGQYGAQCWDLGQRYFTECLGLPASVLGGCGLVSNMLYPPKREVLDRYFEEVPTNKMEQGDVVIWEYGHIAIEDSWDGSQNWFFSQNPNPCEVITINHSGMHAFRLKGETPKITPNVDRDETKNQVEVFIDYLRVRTEPNLNGTILGMAGVGYYNVYDSIEADGYTWYKIADDNWIAYSDEWAKYYPKEETDYKKLYEEQLEKNKLLETEINVLKDKIDKAIKDLT